MANDTPFVAQPNRSPTQSQAERFVRGDDYADAGTGAHDEHARAKAFALHITNMQKNRIRLLAMVKGNPTAISNLRAKTYPLVTAAPPYIVSD